MKIKRENHRRGFTLVELMITIGIIAVLASMAALAVNGAMDAANVAKTRTLIGRLNALVMPRYESYRYRRLPITLPQGATPQQAAKARCDALRELMRMEMPERWTDITDGPAVLFAANGTTPIPPAIWQAYNAYYNAHPPSTSSAVPPQAKCLYLLVTMGLEENDVMENFNQSDIATDPLDGWRYFADAWNNPICFLRWAPGYLSQPAGTSSRSTLPPPFAGVSTLQTGYDPDQTDPTGIYGTPALPGATLTAANTYALYPLIYSAGQDGFYDIAGDSVASPVRYSKTSPPNNPFATVVQPASVAGSIMGPIGVPYPDSTTSGGPWTNLQGFTHPPNVLMHYDDITNHQLSNR